MVFKKINEYATRGINVFKENSRLRWYDHLWIRNKDNFGTGMLAVKGNRERDGLQQMQGLYQHGFKTKADRYSKHLRKAWDHSFTIIIKHRLKLGDKDADAVTLPVFLFKKDTEWI